MHELGGIRLSTARKKTEGKGTTHIQAARERTDTGEKGKPTSRKIFTGHRQIRIRDSNKSQWDFSLWRRLSSSKTSPNTPSNPHPDVKSSKGSKEAHTPQHERKEQQPVKHKKKLTKKDRPKLAEGTEISCNGGRYVVVKILGSGGFGDVYKVKKNGTGEFFAVKTELNEFNGRRLDRLKIEATVMSEYADVKDEERKKHFVALYDKGKTETFKLIVMQLVGPSIEDVRRRILCAEFTRPTAIKICEQTLQSIWDLHAIGFLHNDIKPQNFAIGIDDNEDVIYILDLGIARRYIDKHTNKIKAPRPKVHFMGTVRYASRNCHRSKELSRRDDLETWIYMCIELFSTSALPWKRIVDKQVVLTEKDRFFFMPDPRIFKKAPEGFKRIASYVDSLRYHDEPNYKMILKNIEEITGEEKIDMKQPLDWIGRVGKGVKTAKKEEEKDHRTTHTKMTRVSKDVSFENEEDKLMEEEKKKHSSESINRVDSSYLTLRMQTKCEEPNRSRYFYLRGQVN